MAMNNNKNSPLHFDVFGKKMAVLRENQQWLLYLLSPTSIKARIYDVIIPDDLPAHSIAKYLEDIYHEYATERHPNVVQLDGSELSR